MVQPGQRRSPSGKIEFIGVPYGSRARLIILYLQTEALRTGSAKSSGRSEVAAAARHSAGRQVDRDVRDQTGGSRCRLTFEVNQQGCHGIIHQHIVDAAMFDGEGARHGAMMVDRVLLCDSFFKR